VVQCLPDNTETPRPPFYQLALIALVCLNERVDQMRNYHQNT